VRRTIAVKTVDGTVETVKFTDKTTVHGLKDAAKGADLAGKEGSHVIVHTVGEGADKRHIRSNGSAIRQSIRLRYCGGRGQSFKDRCRKDRRWHQGILRRRDHAVVNTGKDVARYSARGAKKGEHVTVYYTEEAGKKVAHVFKHL